jgi:hypothetical protein
VVPLPPGKAGQSCTSQPSKSARPPPLHLPGVSGAEVTIVSLTAATLLTAAATFGATVIGLRRASRARDEDLRAREDDRQAREDDRTTSFVVERLPTETAPDGRRPLHTFSIHAHRAAARDANFYWTADDTETVIDGPMQYKSLMPGDRRPINLTEPQDVAVAYLNVVWTDDAGQSHRDRIYELKLHGRAQARSPIR